MSELTGIENAVAILNGSPDYPKIQGKVKFRQTRRGVIVSVQISGLPVKSKCKGNFYGFHIHEGESCSGNILDPFADAKAHYNPDGCPHPFHSGDLPSLLGNRGFVLMSFMTDKFTVSEIVGHTVIIHEDPDDFSSSPSGNSGKKIACGVIRED